MPGNLCMSVQCGCVGKSVHKVSQVLYKCTAEPKRSVINYGDGGSYKTVVRGQVKFLPLQKGERAEKVLS